MCINFFIIYLEKMEDIIFFFGKGARRRSSKTRAVIEFISSIIPRGYDFIIARLANRKLVRGKF